MGNTAYVFATAGTFSLRDAVDDLLQPAGVSGQYAVSVKRAEQVNSYLKGESLTFVGHSLGGGTASANAMTTDRPAITFNAAGVSKLTKLTLGLSSENSLKNIRAFIIPGEAVDYYQGNILKSTADGTHIYVHPLLGKLNDNQAKSVRNTIQTAVYRRYLHLIDSMIKALKKSSYK